MINKPKYTTRESVLKLMQSSNDKKEWTENCDTVKKDNNGYPEFWHEIIINSGLINTVLGKNSDTFKTPLTADIIRKEGNQIDFNISSGPTHFPELKEGESLIAVFNSPRGNDQIIICKDFKDLSIMWQRRENGQIYPCYFYAIKETDGSYVIE